MSAGRRARGPRGSVAAPRPADPAVERLARLARLLDAQFGLPGTKVRFGLDGLLGLIPVVGDTATTALAAYIVLEALRLGVPKGTLLRMLANVGLDYAIGLVPVLGDLFDFGWKANLRNVELLRRHRAKGP